MYAVKQIPDETISLDIHFQDDLTPASIATLSTELVIFSFFKIFIYSRYR